MTSQQKIKDALTKEGVGPEWWKLGGDADGTPHIGLDVHIQKGLELVERLITNHGELDGMEVQIDAVFLKEDSMEISFR
jgi:hypothetical protein